MVIPGLRDYVYNKNHQPTCRVSYDCMIEKKVEVMIGKLDYSNKS
jgi:hypothetical protein